MTSADGCSAAACSARYARSRRTSARYCISARQRSRSASAVAASWSRRRYMPSMTAGGMQVHHAVSFSAVQAPAATVSNSEHREQPAPGLQNAGPRKRRGGRRPCELLGVFRGLTRQISGIELGVIIRRLILRAVAVFVFGWAGRVVRCVFGLRDGMLTPQPPRDQHEYPDRHDRHIEKSAAHPRTPCGRTDATRLAAQRSESAVVTSRTVRASAADDEHSARCVARSATPGVNRDSQARVRQASATPLCR